LLLTQVEGAGLASSGASSRASRDSSFTISPLRPILFILPSPNILIRLSNVLLLLVLVPVLLHVRLLIFLLVQRALLLLVLMLVHVLPSIAHHPIRRTLRTADTKYSRRLVDFSWQLGDELTNEL
jgi:hypothetical protein